MHWNHRLKRYRRRGLQLLIAALLAGLVFWGLLALSDWLTPSSTSSHQPTGAGQRGGEGSQAG
jgi:hypothetical protein